jgi:hypothetical protein
MIGTSSSICQGPRSTRRRPAADRCPVAEIWTQVDLRRTPRSSRTQRLAVARCEGPLGARRSRRASTPLIERWHHIGRDGDLDRTWLTGCSCDEASSFEGDDHVVDRRGRYLEEPLKVGFSRSASIQLPVRRNERQVLALKPRERFHCSESVDLSVSGLTDCGSPAATTFNRIQEDRGRRLVQPLVRPASIDPAGRAGQKDVNPRRTPVKHVQQQRDCCST